MLSVSSSSAKWAKKKSGQCPHFTLGTGSYSRRTASDCLCFREFPVFARAGTRFESHLGHSVSAGQTGLEPQSVHKLCWMGPSGALFCWWPPACGQLPPCLLGRRFWVLVTSSLSFTVLVLGLAAHPCQCCQVDQHRVRAGRTQSADGGLRGADLPRVSGRCCSCPSRCRRWSGHPRCPC